MSGQRSRWQPIETAPRDEREESILAIRFGKEAFPMYQVAFWDMEATDPTYPWHVDDAGKGFNYHRDFFTHWMPLPSPPTA